MSPENLELKDQYILQRLGNKQEDIPWPLGRIEIEARNFFIANGELTYRLLREREMESLAREILLYPGKITQLKRTLDISPDGTHKKGAPSEWESAYALSKRLGIARETFQVLTQKAIQEHPEWVRVSIKSGRPRTLYSPELSSLTMNQPQTFIDREGRFKWALASKVNLALVQRYIEDQVKPYLENGVPLTRHSLGAAMGKGTFPLMISIYYPGGYQILKERFGLNHKGLKDSSADKPKRKSRKSWTFEQIELESKERINLFLDYIYQKGEVNPSQLRPFIVKATKKYSVPIVSDGYKPIEVFIPKKESLDPDQKVLCQPKYDRVLGYFWLEGFTKDIYKRRHVFSKRFYQGDPTPYSWRGPEIQSLVDWIHGLITIDKVKLVEISLENKSKTFTLERTASSIIILQLHANPNLSQFDKVSLIPNQDEYAEWLEVRRGDKKGKNERVLTYKITRDRENKLDSSWLGPERQRFKEFLEGRLPPDRLLPFIVPIKSEGRFYPVVLNGKSVELHLPANWKTQPGEQIIAVPSINGDGDLILNISTGEAQTGNLYFIFNKETSRFFKVSAPQESTISPDEANEDLDRLLEG